LETVKIKCYRINFTEYFFENILRDSITIRY